MPKQQNQDFRNYDKEAKELIGPLSPEQKYELYDIVITKLRNHQSNERRKELTAVRRAIENHPRLQPERLQSIRRGYQSEMAATAKISDGSTRPSPKKV